jgi:hypothetical protein
LVEGLRKRARGVGDALLTCTWIWVANWPRKHNSRLKATLPNVSAKSSLLVDLVLIWLVGCLPHQAIRGRVRVGGRI